MSLDTGVHPEITMRYSVECLFPSIVHNIEINLPKSIEEFCLKQYNKDSEGVKFSNKGGGWQSREIYEDTVVTDLLYETFRDTLYVHSQYQEFDRITIANHWVNINPPNSYNTLHNHPQAHWSGVIYVKAPIGSGEIWFPNPDTFKTCSEVLFYKNEFKDYTKIHDHLSFTPREGTIIIFPSHLNHGVHMNESSEDRISIAFNCHVRSSP